MRTHFGAALMACAAILGSSADGKAEEHGHVASAGDIRVVHPWVRAAAAGGSTLVFMEIENAGAPAQLVSVKSDVAARAAVVGIVMTGTEISTADMGPLDIPSGEFHLDPGGLAIKLDNLSKEFVAGEEVEIVVTFEPGGELVVHAEVEPEGATEHHHAGHSHD